MLPFRCESLSEMCPLRRLIPWLNQIIKFGSQVEKILNFSTRNPDHLHMCLSRVYGPFFSKNRLFGTAHGDNPVRDTDSFQRMLCPC